MNIEVIRQIDGKEFTLGEMRVDGKHFGYVCEDVDRKLEDYDASHKVYGQTAIPRGEYKIEVSFSTRFKKELPILIDVPYFTGIRIHGGNTADDSHGCILLGRTQTINGVRDCSERVVTLTKMISDAEDRGEECRIEIT